MFERRYFACMPKKTRSKEVNTATVFVKIPPELKAAVERRARAEDLSLSQVIRRLAAQYAGEVSQ